ncbi:MAG: tyrosine-type recombinase/integrase [Bradyrhizobium sp.]|uniref:tyrosine-type recombinase/integrase n=1 Tax=Bradyrhizobium sp. TaxID=376 RepID=UPI003D11F439
MVTVLDHYQATHADRTPGAVQAKWAGDLLLEWVRNVQRRASANASDFTRPWQDAFVRWCASEKDLAVGTISRNMSIINAAMNHAVKPVIVEEDGVQREVQLLKYAVPVVYKPADIAKITGKPTSAPRDWLPTFEQLAAFIDGIGRRTKKGTWDENRENLFRYVVLALNTWARPEAILDLHVPSQVDHVAGLVKLNPQGRAQTKKVRPTIPLTQNLRGWLQLWNLDYPIHRDGEPLTTIKKVFKANAVEAKLPQLTPYTLRHFMATNVRKMPGLNVTREQRQEWLGHKPQDTTSWYEHHDDEWLREARDATDAVLSRLEGHLRIRTLDPGTSHLPLTEADQVAPRLKLVHAK